MNFARATWSRPWPSVADDRSRKQCPGTFKQRGKRRSQHRQCLCTRSKKAKEWGKAKRSSRELALLESSAKRQRQPPFEAQRADRFLHVPVAGRLLWRSRLPSPAHQRTLLRQSQFRRVYKVHTLTIYSSHCQGTESPRSVQSFSGKASGLSETHEEGQHGRSYQVVPMMPSASGKDVVRTIQPSTPAPIPHSFGHSSVQVPFPVRSVLESQKTRRGILPRSELRFHAVYKSLGKIDIFIEASRSSASVDRTYSEDSVGFCG